MPNGGMTYSE